MEKINLKHYTFASILLIIYHSMERTIGNWEDAYLLFMLIISLLNISSILFYKSLLIKNTIIKIIFSLSNSLIFIYLWQYILANYFN